MKIIITGRKRTPRDSFKEHAEKKLQKVERFFDDSAEAKVTATVEKSCQIVEVTVATRGMIFRSEERAQNMNEALDKCVDSLIRQIRKNKTRLEKRLREGSLDSVIIASEPEEEALDFNVVRTKHVSVKPQSVDEAILQMNLLDPQFYLFRNAETDEVNVVYKRQDGGYGVIVPEAE